MHWSVVRQLLCQRTTWGVTNDTITCIKRLSGKEEGYRKTGISATEFSDNLVPNPLLIRAGRAEIVWKEEVDCISYLPYSVPSLISSKPTCNAIYHSILKSRACNRGSY